MPQPSVRADVVVLLTEVDYDRHDDASRLYRCDGSPFTAAEHALLSTATRAEFSAANAQMRLENEWAHELDAMKEAFVELLMKYFPRLPEGSTVSDVVGIMTDEDYAEYERLLPIVTAQDTLEYVAEHGDD
ncbi:hypothetical protein C9F11_17785 [Streptomyces sp. YIM 121038]|uniref:hypothetical protein n=1 Tax=Streptomyces sp. YIM 121038 TaxID=2136401 RepID=UPI00110FFED7|nr:hypothetical protein [Streptomyces sp. YIM 121038]QCX77209.1 hypothetical protein C9F11_17785 [Streptomyces sp. YIM 121038]